MTIGLRHALVLVFVTCVTISIDADHLGFVPNVTFTPPNPMANDLITARINFFYVSCFYNTATVVSGTTVRTTLAVVACTIGLQPDAQTEFVPPFGPLPAGTYTYELYFQSPGEEPVLHLQRALVITAGPPAPIPALSEPLMIFLAVALAGVGLLFLGRQ